VMTLIERLMLFLGITDPYLNNGLINLGVLFISITLSPEMETNHCIISLEDCHLR